MNHQYDIHCVRPAIAAISFWRPKLHTPTSPPVEPDPATAVLVANDLIRRTGNHYGPDERLAPSPHFPMAWAITRDHEEKAVEVAESALLNDLP